MGWIVAYTCDRCPLAFEVGEYAHWNMNGRTVKTVCSGCGTMHRLESERGTCRVLALPGPVRSLPLVTRESAWGDGREYQDYEWTFAESDWQIVAHFQAVPELVQLTCGRCGVAGMLASLESVGPHGSEQCPVCRGALAVAYFDTVN